MLNRIQGEGSCGYKVWHKTTTTVIDVEEESGQRDEGTDDREVIPRNTDRYKCVEKSRTTSRRPPKRSRCGDMIGDESILRFLCGVGVRYCIFWNIPTSLHVAFE